MGVIAAVQSRPVYLDPMATAQRAADLIGQCAERGAWLAVFPETYLPGNPEFIDRAAIDTAAYLAFEEAFLEAAIRVPGPETEVIARACARHGITVAMGVTERPQRSGTLYNTLLYFGADGRITGRHRKIMPTYNERIVWGMGDGTTLRAIETPQGVVSGLICWENYMPVARAVLYAQGPLVHVAPTLNPATEAWVAQLRAIANEARAWVVSVGNYLTADDIPERLRAFGLYEPGEVVNSGGSFIVDPATTVVAGPVHGQDAILTAEVDPREALRRKRRFDVVGHYGRADLFDLRLAGQPVPLQIEDADWTRALPSHVWQVPGQG